MLQQVTQTLNWLTVQNDRYIGEVTMIKTQKLPGVKIWSEKTTTWSRKQVMNDEVFEKQTQARNYRTK